jgi:hypothetical protein
MLGFPLSFLFLLILFLPDVFSFSLTHFIDDSPILADAGLNK